jgi:hypothetical protein
METPLPALAAQESARNLLASGYIHGLEETRFRALLIRFPAA